MPRNKNRFGNHQRIHIGKFQTDRRGIVSGNVELHNPEEFDRPQWSLLSVLTGPAQAGITFVGLPCVGVERTYDADASMATYNYSFDGQLEGRDWEFPENEAVFELDITMREEPIETHPDFENLATKYNWDPVRREFSRNIPKDTTTGGLAGANDSSKRATNPLYGVTSYLVPGVVYRRSYGRRAVPASLFTNIGMIVRPPGIAQFEGLSIILGPNRNWLKLAPKVVRRGNAVAITEEYLLSGPHGVNKDIYSADALTF